MAHKRGFKLPTEKQLLERFSEGTAIDDYGGNLKAYSKAVNKLGRK